MKKLLLLFLISISANFYAQNFYNGSFENNALNTCSTTLYNHQFNNNMPHVVAFGNNYNGPSIPLGKSSIQDSGCSVVPQHGKWCVGLRAGFQPLADAIAIELDAQLDSGTTYYVSFYCYGNKSFQNFDCDLAIGMSPYNFLFGTPIHTVTANYLSWKNSSFSFMAIDTSQFITVKPVYGYNSWIQVDNFVISKNPILLGVDNYALNDLFEVYPNPAQETLNIQFKTSKAQTELRIYNSMGLTVLNETIGASENTKLDISSLPPGYYTLRLLDNNRWLSKKIIITK
ncbi:hypothetical protein CNR22_17215 [Sphingobacteriaceae bacterium]|nr:hypothetical protein CNR22_17215 [Sphingobacteriaceae bacterium]